MEKSRELRYAPRDFFIHRCGGSLVHRCGGRLARTTLKDYDF